MRDRIERKEKVNSIRAYFPFVIDLSFIRLLLIIFSQQNLLRGIHSTWFITTLNLLEIITNYIYGGILWLYLKDRKGNGLLHTPP